MPADSAGRQSSVRALLYAIPIGALGGLIGLGGAEFRLPILVGALKYSARQAVPLNLAVSLVTLASALVTRTRTLTLAPVQPLVPVMLAMIASAVLAASFGASMTARLSRERLERLILLFLVGIGLLLIVEGLLPHGLPPLIPGASPLRAMMAILFGLGIGVVSSVLGVAGGELIIPTLVFVYGADIKAAGTASLLISLPTVAVGVLRYSSLGAYAERTPLIRTVLPMGIGSLIGAAIGGGLVGMVSQTVLKFGLGILLNISAYRIFSQGRRQTQSRER